MKKYISFVLLLLLFTKCSSQKKYKMEIFNLKEFKQNNNLLREKIVVKDSVIEKLGQNDSDYYKLISHTFNPFNKKIYFFKNLNIKNEGQYFYDVPTIYKEYNTNGNLLTEIDFNKERKFSIEDLNNKMKVKFQIDLLQNVEGKGVSITRTPSGNKCYAIIVKNYYGDGLHKNICIDVDNGTTLYDKEIHYKK